MKTRSRTTLGGTQFDLIAKALADPRRMALLESIAGVEECPCQRLRRQFSISKAGLVEAWREGQYLHCEVRREVLKAYTSELMRRVSAGIQDETREG
jgi:ArsR family transcriptional regulator